MSKAGTLPLNMYRMSDYPKDKVLFSPNAEQQSVTSAKETMPCTSLEGIKVVKKGKATDEAEVEEDEEEIKSTLLA